MDLLDRLLVHDQWATARLLDLCRDLTDAQLDQPVDVGHRTLRATFEHMIPNVEFWTRLMVERPMEDGRDGGSVARLIEEYEGYSAGSVATLIEDHDRFYATFAALARRLRDEKLLDDTYIDLYGVRKTFVGTILMVVLHNTEHRTEVLHILERLGVPDLPEVDPGLWEYETLVA